MLLSARSKESLIFVFRLIICFRFYCHQPVQATYVWLRLGVCWSDPGVASLVLTKNIIYQRVLWEGEDLRAYNCSK